MNENMEIIRKVKIPSMKTDSSSNDILPNKITIR